MLMPSAISEGSVCVFSIIVWLAMLSAGITIDYILLPSMLLGSMVSAIMAPYMTRVFPERVWRWFVPGYCCVLAVYVFYKIVPEIIEKLAG